MATFTVPTRSEVSETNQAIFDNLQHSLGFVPNLFATFAYSETALGNYWAIKGNKTSLKNKEREAINLIVSQTNGCVYCQAAHTAIAKMNGFTDEQALEIRRGDVTFNAKLDAMVKLAKNIVETNGHADTAIVDNFLAVGYTKGHLVDVIVQVGEKTIMNYLHTITDIPIDFPTVPILEMVEA